MVALTSDGAEPWASISVEICDDGCIRLHLPRAEPQPDDTMEIVLTREQAQLLALMLAAAQQAASG